MMVWFLYFFPVAAGVCWPRDKLQEQSWPPTFPGTAQMLAEQRGDQNSGIVEQLRVCRDR